MTFGRPRKYLGLSLPGACFCCCSRTRHRRRTKCTSLQLTLHRLKHPPLAPLIWVQAKRRIEAATTGSDEDHPQAYYAACLNHPLHLDSKQARIQSLRRAAPWAHFLLAAWCLGADHHPHHHHHHRSIDPSMSSSAAAAASPSSRRYPLLGPKKASSGLLPLPINGNGNGNGGGPRAASSASSHETRLLRCVCLCLPPHSKSSSPSSPQSIQQVAGCLRRRAPPPRHLGLGRPRRPGPTRHGASVHCAWCFPINQPIRSDQSIH
jgi:hypothetical protein